MPRLGLDYRRIRFRFVTKASDSLLQAFQTSSGAHPAPFSMVTEIAFSEVKADVA